MLISPNNLAGINKKFFDYAEEDSSVDFDNNDRILDIKKLIEKNNALSLRPSKRSNS